MNQKQPIEDGYHNLYQDNNSEATNFLQSSKQSEELFRQTVLYLYIRGWKMLCWLK